MFTVTVFLEVHYQYQVLLVSGSGSSNSNSSSTTRNGNPYCRLPGTSINKIAQLDLLKEGPSESS